MPEISQQNKMAADAVLTTQHNVINRPFIDRGCQNVKRRAKYRAE